MKLWLFIDVVIGVLFVCGGWLEMKYSCCLYGDKVGLELC